MPRVAVLLTLVLTGLRIEELCGLDGRHVDLARGTLTVTDELTKGNTAGARTIPLLPALRERLTEHVMDYRGRPRRACLCDPQRAAQHARQPVSRISGIPQFRS